MAPSGMTQLRINATTGHLGRLLSVLGLVGSSLLCSAGSPVQGQNTCNANISINYDSVQMPNTIGSVDTVRLTMSTGTIVGGTKITIQRVRFNLDCAQASLPGCTDDGLVVRYQGDSTIDTDCAGVTWASNQIAGGTSNEVVFTATPALELPPNNAGCFLSFDIQKLSGSNDTTPNLIEQRAFYSAGDATCDNDPSPLSSTSAQTASLPFVSDPGRFGAPLLGGFGIVFLTLSLAILGFRAAIPRR